MGHSNMLFAVAGLSEEESNLQTQKLADGKWAGFSPAERLALQFAHKQAKNPAAITARDVAALTKTFGEHRTLDLIWKGAWSNYMTRVADAFQLPLEKVNVFQRSDNPK